MPQKEIMPHNVPERLRQIEWLVSDGRLWLLDDPTTERTQSRLLPWQNAMLDEQRQFRKRARRRFPDAEKWLWTERSLAQASDWWSACFKSSLFPLDKTVIDACCGAGVDLVALAGRTANQNAALNSRSGDAHVGDPLTVAGYDRDPVLTCLAQSNLATHSCRGIVSEESFSANQVTHRSWLHIDPDRRIADQRTLEADEFSPCIDEILTVVTQCEGAVVKLAPKTQFMPRVHEQIEQQSTRLWLGNQGECRQQLLLFGAAVENLRCRTKATAEHRFAVLAEPEHAGEKLEMGYRSTLFSSSPLENCKVADRALEYVYDLHSVLHASELNAAWAEQMGLQAIATPQGYFTSDSRLERSEGNTPAWAQCFQVLDVVAWDDRKVRKALRGLKAGPVEVKNRLLRLDANHFQRRYSIADGMPVTLLVTKLGSRVRAIIAQRVSA